MDRITWKRFFNCTFSTEVNLIQGKLSQRIATLLATAGAVASLSALAVSLAHAAEFVVRPGKETKVVFVSRAAMEKFEGKTNRMEGTITVDPAAIGDTATVRFEVELASLDTGIKMRNTHMRENHLQTAKYPKAVFEGAGIPGRPVTALASDRPTTLDVEGTFTLHGVSRRIRIAVEVTHRPAPPPERLEFKTEFPVALADYGIERPQFLFLKLSDVQTVRISAVATATPPKGVE